MKFGLSLTIKLKLVLMGFVAVVALALLSIISSNAANVVKRATNDNQVMLEASIGLKRAFWLRRSGITLCPAFSASLGRVAYALIFLRD